MRSIEVEEAAFDINGAIKIKNSSAFAIICRSVFNPTIVKIQRTTLHENIASVLPKQLADGIAIANSCIIYCDSSPSRYGDDAKQIYSVKASSNCKTIAIDCDFSGDEG